jgi:hypothetical protein
MKRGYYSVYRNGSLIKDNIDCKEAGNIVGIKSERVSLIAFRGTEINGYYITNHHLEVTPTKVKNLTGQTDKTKIVVDPEFEKEWDKARFKLNPKARDRHEMPLR